MTFSFRPRRSSFEAADRSLGEHAGGLLERSRRDERLGRQRRLGDAQQHRLQLAPASLPACSARSFSSMSARAIELLAAQERVSPESSDLGLAQHLANDHLDVLVVDLHALQAVDVLDLATR